jgi:D-alanyl-lipoteichoic acid acyltransferase DltB (MBOAT superfamily)
MFFNSVTFLYFFLLVGVIYYATPHRFRWVPLLVGSYVFYGFFDVRYLIYLAIPTIVVFLLARALDRTKGQGIRKFVFFGGIVASIGLLFWFKYLNLFRETFGSLFVEGGLEPLRMILPIGISFYSFKLVSYLADVYLERLSAERHMGYFALYVSFFPQLLAGPIDRAISFIPELKKRVELDWDRIGGGLRLIIWGLFKKIVIADRMALFVDQVFRDPVHYNGINLLFGVYFYTVQIYCDFSGYSDIAIGLARILGFKSMDNFNFPYFSRSLAQFWNRWHISLSTWLRDYLFLPMSYSILRWTKKETFLNVKIEKWAYAGGMSVTMFLGGLWHGASWTFVGWGLIHGFYLVFAHFSKRSRKRWARRLGIKQRPRLYAFWQGLVTFHLVSFAWIFFRAPSFASAVEYIRNIHFGLSGSGMVHLIYTFLFLAVFALLEVALFNRERFGFVKRMPQLAKLAAIVLFVCLTIIFSVDSSNEFIYFQF